MASEVSGLEPLHGFIKQENKVVPVHFQFAKKHGRQPEFIERKLPEIAPRSSPPTPFADEPPTVKLPLNPEQPTASANHFTTVRSIVVAEGADRQDVAFWCKTLEAKSPKTPTGSPEPNTYPKNRGEAGREYWNTRFSKSNASVPIPSSGRSCAKICSSLAPLTSAGYDGRLESDST